MSSKACPIVISSAI